MPKFAANLTLMYTEFDFLDRFAAAAADGFTGVEFQFPYEFPAHEIQARLHAHSLTPILFNGPPGNWAQGERGLAALPGREEEFRQSIDLALNYAQVLGAKRLHVMAGLCCAEQDNTQHRAVYLRNLAHAAQQALPQGITILIEPINTRDIPGYFLNQQAEAQSICQELSMPNLKVQFDVYHCQISEGDVAMKLRGGMANIGHIQIAGVPERNEPDSGELNYPYLFRLIDDLDYQGWIGCEYRPKGPTSNGLDWVRPWLLKRTSQF